MKILVSAFTGANNSSHIILNEITNKCDKICFLNSKSTSEQQLYTALGNIQYDYIIMLGQKPVIKDKISIETTAKAKNDVVRTDFYYGNTIDFFVGYGYAAYLSNNAGTSYCNHIYYSCLKHIANTKTKAIFIHIPYIKNIKSITLLAAAFDAYFNSLSPFTISH